MISKSSEYALRAVACLAATDGPCSADLLADQTKVPRRYLNRILQDLVLASVVQSRPGPGGGYSLLRDSSDISILDVVNSVSPIERIKKCPLGITSHHKLCPLHAELDRACAQVELAFAKVSIRQLVESGGEVQPLCDV